MKDQRATYLADQNRVNDRLVVDDHNIENCPTECFHTQKLQISENSCTAPKVSERSRQTEGRGEGEQRQGLQRQNIIIVIIIITQISHRCPRGDEGTAEEGGVEVPQAVRSLTSD